MTKPVVWSEEEMITGKKCSKCGLIKPYSNYSRNRTNKGGFSYDCNDCHLESCKKWREKNREAYKEANKRSYRKKVVSGKKQAERKLHYAIDTGSIKKENCVLCGNPAEAHHHFGYDHPLEVIWLCKKHHMSHHKYIRILTEVAVQDGTKKAVFDERQKLLAEIEGWLVDEQQIPEAHIESAIKVSDDWSLSYESDLITARNILRAELRAKLEAMKGGK